MRQINPEAWILAPGIGAQGGNLRLALTAGLRDDGLGMIVPVSRSVMNAEDPRAAAAALRDEINQIRAEVIVNTQKQDREDDKRFNSLIKGLFEVGCVKFGNFTLASGKQSPVYLDLRRLVSYPEVLDLAVEAYIDTLIKLDYDFLAGVPYAALPIASIAASKLRRPMVYPRKEAKQHGTGQLVEGVFEQGQRAVMVEDVITSGGSLLTTRDALQGVGLAAYQAVVLVDREQGGVNALAQQGLQVYPVIKFSDILATLHQEGKIDDATYTMVSDYLKG